MFGHGRKKFPLLMTPIFVKNIHTLKPFLLKEEMRQIILLALQCKKIKSFGKSVPKNVDQSTTWIGSTVEF